MLSEDEKRYLLSAARRAIDAALSELPPATPPHLPFPILLQPSGAFVTLREESELRGCVGYIDPIKPLIVTVEEAAVRAAFDDPRFEPLGPGDLGRISIEISVLSPLQPVTDISEITIGTHGVVVEARNARGLLLPQVAVEYGWDQHTFLEQTFRKAGLSPARRSGATVSVFTAQVFSERHHAVSRPA